MTVWYTAPTAIRMLIKSGPELAAKYRFPQLRFIASVGEPLNPEAVWWGKRVLGLPIHDNWWKTETGGIMIANTPAFDIKPGSMGRPLPGVDTYVVRRKDDGEVSVIAQPDVEGELALRLGWPSMFRSYLHEDARYRKCFTDTLDLTGDLAKRDADGYFWFIGRADDVIKSAGHLVGPFEVESALTDHPAVAEAAVIGKPDPTVGEVVKAFVLLKDGFSPDDAPRSGPAWPCPQETGRGGGAQGNRVRRYAAAHAQREDHAAPAQGPRTRPARGRHLHDRNEGRAWAAGGVVVTDAKLAHGLLSDMTRVRRMEEKCAELYSAAKIRGLTRRSPSPTLATRAWAQCSASSTRHRWHWWGWQTGATGLRGRRRNPHRHHRASHPRRRSPGERWSPWRVVPGGDQRVAPTA